MLLALRSLYETPKRGGSSRRPSRRRVPQQLGVPIPPPPPPPAPERIDAIAYITGAEFSFSAGTIEASGEIRAIDDAEAMATIMVALMP